MCGRFFVDDETAREIERIVRKVDAQLKKHQGIRDILPMDTATIISADNNGLIAKSQKWGFPGYGDQKVIINARSESVLEKRMFQDSILHRRIVIPATGFYEWNAQKEKVTFTAARDKQTLFLAGFYGFFEGEDRFVILTTGANETMRTVHDRMPLVLEHHEIEEWLLENKKVDGFLKKIPPALQKKQEYEQQKLLL